MRRRGRVGFDAVFLVALLNRGNATVPRPGGGMLQVIIVVNRRCTACTILSQALLAKRILKDGITSKKEKKAVQEVFRNAGVVVKLRVLEPAAKYIISQDSAAIPLISCLLRRGLVPYSRFVMSCNHLESSIPRRCAKRWRGHPFNHLLARFGLVDYGSHFLTSISSPAMPTGA